MKLRVFFLLLFYLLQATISQNLKFINLDNRPYSEASYPKYGVLKANPKLDSLPDNFTFCISFFYEFGFPTVYLQVDWIKFEYDAVRITFVSLCSSISARAMEHMLATRPSLGYYTIEGIVANRLSDSKLFETFF